jgi:hypothetical protein
VRVKCSSSARMRANVFVCGRALLWRSTTSTLDVSIPRLLFRMALRSLCVCVSQYNIDVIVVLCVMNSTISTPLLSQKIFAISFLAGRRLIKLFFGLFGECVYIHYFEHSLLSTFTNKIQVPSPDTHIM